jgi:2'-5' RNA ligase
VPPAPIRDLLIDCMEGVEGAGWQSDDQLHLTLRFVGEVDHPLANDLADRLGRVAFPPFPLAVRGVGHFERKGRTRAIWAGIAPSPELEVLQRKIERACQEAGLEPEHRRFTPHITLARLNSASGPAAPFLLAQASLASAPFTVSRFTLFESHLGHGGSIYEAVADYPLQSHPAR